MDNLSPKNNEDSIFKELLFIAPAVILMVYLLFPFMFDFFIAYLPESEPIWFMWDSPLNANVAAIIGVSFVAIGVILQLIAAFRGRSNGVSNDIKFGLLAGVFILGTIAFSLFIAFVVFEVSSFLLMGVGIDVDTAGVIAFALALLAIIVYAKC